MSNPFDDEEGLFLALANSEGQYSLWPAFAPTPPGWRVALGGGTRRECLDYIDATWTDPRPLSLIAKQGDGAREGAAS